MTGGDHEPESFSLFAHKISKRKAVTEEAVHTSWDVLMWLIVGSCIILIIASFCVKRKDKTEVAEPAQNSVEEPDWNARIIQVPVELRNDDWLNSLSQEFTERSEILSMQTMEHLRWEASGPMGVEEP